MIGSKGGNRTERIWGKKKTTPDFEDTSTSDYKGEGASLEESEVKFSCWQGRSERRVSKSDQSRRRWENWQPREDSWSHLPMGRSLQTWVQNMRIFFFSPWDCPVAISLTILENLASILLHIRNNLSNLITLSKMYLFYKRFISILLNTNSLRIHLVSSCTCNHLYTQMMFLFSGTHALT